MDRFFKDVRMWRLFISTRKYTVFKSRTSGCTFRNEINYAIRINICHIINMTT